MSKRERPQLVQDDRLGLVANPTVVQLTLLSSELRAILGHLTPHRSTACEIQAFAERLQKEDIQKVPEIGSKESSEWFVVEALCYWLHLFATKTLPEVADSAAAAISHDRLREKVITTLYRIRDILSSPALATIARPFQGLDDNGEPVQSPKDVKLLKRLYREISDNLKAAVQEAQGLALLADQVYVHADHIREQERDMAALARYSESPHRVGRALPTASQLSKTQNRPESGQRPKRRHWSKRLQIKRKTVYLDGEPVPLGLTCEGAEEALDFLRELIKDPGDWKSGTDIGKATMRENVRFDRVLKRLPEVIKALIETDRRKGNRLRPPDVDSP